MSGPVDRDLVGHLLEDQSLSYREIGRRAGCSDWTVRRIARDLAREVPPPNSSGRYDTAGPDNAADDAPLQWWVMPLFTVGAIAAAIFLGRRNDSL